MARKSLIVFFLMLGSAMWGSFMTAGRPDVAFIVIGFSILITLPFVVNIRK